MTVTPAGAIGRGLIAGAVGTAAMTAAQTAYYKLQQTEASTTPAEVAKRIIEGVFHRSVPEERTEMLNQAMHWSYGTSWGAGYGIIQSSRHGSMLRAGAMYGLAVWAASLVHLPAMQLAPPVWEYPPSQLASDTGFHLIYGVATALAYAALRG